LDFEFLIILSRHSGLLTPSFWLVQNPSRDDSGVSAPADGPA